MKRRPIPFVATLVCSLAIRSGSQAAPVGTAFTYQGYLEKPAGVPVDDTCNFRFGLWDAASGGSQQGTSPQTENGVSVSAGVFTVNDLDFGDDAFNGTGRWMEIEVICSLDPGFPTFELLAPRVELTPAPHALALPSLYTKEKPDGFGGVENVNVVGGLAPNVTAGVEGATISGGGGIDNCNALGAVNTVTDHFGTIGGGNGNTAGDNAGDLCDAQYATVAGGRANTASARWATVGGGWNNAASEQYATVGGGRSNACSGFRGTIGGGYDNTVNEAYATVAGGDGNTASGGTATVCGGGSNTASGPNATVGGGTLNQASGQVATIAGGDGNEASGNDSAVGGGAANDATGFASTVGGGIFNVASGESATVAGGRLSSAAGDYSFAAGRRAKANHDGAFVWADSVDADFASTMQDQFLIRAKFGVGIGTNAPAEKLHVAGSVKVDFDVKVDESTLNSATPISTEQSTMSTGFVELATFDIPDQNADRLMSVNVHVHARGSSSGETAEYTVRGFCYGTGSTTDLADYYAGGPATSAPLLGAVNVRNSTYADYYLNLGPFAVSDDQRWRFILFYRSRNASETAYVDLVEFEARSLRYEY